MEAWRGLSARVHSQGLSLVLSEGSLRDGEEKEPPAEEDSGDAETLHSYQWLLRDLPRLPLFDSVRATTALALQQAIHMETDPQTVSAYLVYLSQHTPVEEQAQHSDLALVRGDGAGRAVPRGDSERPASFSVASLPEQHRAWENWCAWCQTRHCGPQAWLPVTLGGGLAAPDT